MHQRKDLDYISETLQKLGLLLDDIPPFVRKNISLLPHSVKPWMFFISTIWFCKHSSMWFLTISHDALHIAVHS